MVRLASAILGNKDCFHPSPTGIENQFSFWRCPHSYWQKRKIATRVSTLAFDKALFFASFVRKIPGAGPIAKLLTLPLETVLDTTNTLLGPAIEALGHLINGDMDKIQIEDAYKDFFIAMFTNIVLVHSQ